MSRSLNPVANLREAGCGRVRRLLDSYLAGELTVETNHEILEHLAGCAACRAESGARERLRAAVRRIHAAAAEPRPLFEADVRALLARTKPASFGRPLPAILLAAAALGGFAALVGVLAPVPRAGPVAAAPAGSAVRFASRTQARCTLAYEWPLGPRAASDLEARLTPAFVPALRAATKALPGWDPVAAHRCAHGEHRVVHVVFRRPGETGPASLVSVIALPRSAGALPTAGVAAIEDAAGRSFGLSAATDEGFDVVGTESEAWLLFVVTSRGRDETLRIARAALPAVAAVLAP